MATVSRRNLVKDPRFAVLPNVWSTGTPSFSTTHVRTDRTKSVKVDFPTDDGSYPAVWGADEFVITSGQTLHVGAWVYEDDDTGVVQVVRDAPRQEFQHNTVRGWNWITRSFAGPLTSEIYFGVYHYGGYSLWFSDPIAEIRTTALSSTDYFDALFPTETRVEDNATRSYGWEGAANNSPSLQYDWELPDATVYPEDPLVLQPYCVGSTLIPPSISKPVNTMSIVYTQSGSVLPGGSTTVTATAQSGYVFPSSVPGWTATGSNKVLNFVVYWSNPNCEVLGEMIVWNRPEDQIFEIGIDRGVLYVGSLAVPWNGLTDVTIKQEGGDIKSFYMDGVKRQTRVIPTDFAADINAFTAPALFRSCDGFNEINTGFVVDNAPRKPFGLAYRSLVGNGIKGKNFAYKIHLIYNAFASSGDKVNTSISDSSDPETYSWTLTATPDRSIDGNYGAHYILDSREVPLAKLSQIETILYGTVSIAPRLPLPSEIDTIIG